MSSDKRLSKYLGAAFVFVFAASLLGGVLSASAVGSEVLADTVSISDILVNVSNNLTLMRVSLMLELANGLGIVVLAALLYLALRPHDPTLALIAFGWWIVEAVAFVLSRIGIMALLPLSAEYASAADPASVEVLADFLYFGLAEHGYAIHMLFFCMGALVWYFLMVRSRLVPRVLSVWGLAAVSLVTVATLIGLWDPAIEVPIALYVPYIPFELVFGVWLMVRGFNPAAEAAKPTRALA